MIDLIVDMGLRINGTVSVIQDAKIVASQPEERAPRHVVGIFEALSVNFAPEALSVNLLCTGGRSVSTFVELIVVFVRSQPQSMYHLWATLFLCVDHCHFPLSLLRR
jgi:hypothetical protein